MTSLVASSVTKLSFVFRRAVVRHKLSRHYYLPYFQDDWQVTPTSTANLGIRWITMDCQRPDNRNDCLRRKISFHGAGPWIGSFNLRFPVPLNTPPCPIPDQPSLIQPELPRNSSSHELCMAPSSLLARPRHSSGFGIYTARRHE